MRWELRPARDLALPLQARMRSLQREQGLAGLALNATWRLALRIYLRLAHRLDVTGRENLPAEPPFVLIANHGSHLDALALAGALRGAAARRVHALAAGEVFFGSGMGAAFAAYAINALPIWRGRTGRRDLPLLRERLVQDGLVYILFPEGTRSRTGDMGPFLPGLAKLVAGTEVSVVPCHLSGAYEAWPPQRKLPRPGRIRLRMGPPLRFAGVPDDVAGRQTVTEACRAAVVALAPSDQRLG